MVEEAVGGVVRAGGRNSGTAVVGQSGSPSIHAVVVHMASLNGIPHLI